MASHPVHDQLKSLGYRPTTVASFLEWLDEQGLAICERPGTERSHFETLYVPTPKTHETLVAEFFEIDRSKLEAEKRAMLADLRAAAPSSRSDGPEGKPTDEGRG